MTNKLSKIAIATITSLSLLTGCMSEPPTDAGDDAESIEAEAEDDGDKVYSGQVTTDDIPPTPSYAQSCPKGSTYKFTHVEFTNDFKYIDYWAEIGSGDIIKAESTHGLRSGETNSTILDHDVGIPAQLLVDGSKSDAGIIFSIRTTPKWFGLDNVMNVIPECDGKKHVVIHEKKEQLSLTYRCSYCRGDIEVEGGTPKQIDSCNANNNNYLADTDVNNGGGRRTAADRMALTASVFFAIVAPFHEALKAHESRYGTRRAVVGACYKSLSRLVNDVTGTTLGQLRWDSTNTDPVTYYVSRQAYLDAINAFFAATRRVYDSYLPPTVLQAVGEADANFFESLGTALGYTNTNLIDKFFAQCPAIYGSNGVH